METKEKENKTSILISILIFISIIMILFGLFFSIFYNSTNEVIVIEAGGFKLVTKNIGLILSAFGSLLAILVIKYLPEKTHIFERTQNINPTTFIDIFRKFQIFFIIILILTSIKLISEIGF